MTDNDYDRRHDDATRAGGYEAHDAQAARDQRPGDVQAVPGERRHGDEPDAEASRRVRSQLPRVATDRSESVGARWAEGIGRVEIHHDRWPAKRVYLRLELDDAKKLRDDLDAVIAEREPDAEFGAMGMLPPLPEGR